MGAMICHALATSDVDFQMKSLGVDGQFGQSAYTALELYEKHGLDALTIHKTVKNWL